MGISSAMFSGVSGLNTLGSSMSVIGDNIANVNTIGFKSARTTFETLLAQNITSASGTSQVGRGVAMSSVDAVFLQGSFEQTSEPTDMAIGGKGFFMVRSPQTGVFYTRAGHFKFDEEGYLVNPAGLRVQGWILDPNSIDPQGAITDIQINATSSSPNATSQIDIAVSLDSTAEFQLTPATVVSDPATRSGFFFQDTVNDTITITGAGGPAVIDLITAASTLEEGEVYNGDAVANALFEAIDASTLTGTYTVSYDEASNTFTITSTDATATVAAGTSANALFGFSETAATPITTPTATAGVTSATGNETAYNITALNRAFTVTVDGTFVNVALDTGVYTIPELRLEIEQEINEQLADAVAAGTTAPTVDVRYDYVNNRFMIMSSSRDTNSTIQLGAGANNFLSTINMTNYEQITGPESNGYTLPGLTQSREPTDSMFYFTVANGGITTSLGAANLVNGTTFIAGYHTGEEVATRLEEILDALGTDYDVVYDGTTQRFTITQGSAGVNLTIDWLNAVTGAEVSTAANELGFTGDLTSAVPTGDSAFTGAGSVATSDNTVAFNIIAGTNDTLRLTVNGTPSNPGTPVDVTIDAGVYNGEALATELETKINEALADQGLSDTVDVTYDPGYGIRIASSVLGQDSTMQVDTTSALVSETLNMDDDTLNYGQGFDIASPEAGEAGSTNYTTSLVVYDSLGNQHTLSFYFRKAYIDDDQNTTWEWFAYVPAADTASGESEVQARGTMTFNQNGILTNQSPTQWLTTQTNGEAGTGFDFSGGAAPQQEVDIDFGGNRDTNDSSQFSGSNSTLYQTQDGFGSGFLQDVSTDADGVISGTYSNGQVLFLARVALANFVNPWGLSREGGNLFSETRQSGQPLTGTPGSAGLGTISPNSLEQSNVDLSTEFVNMIIQQRGFQANSRVITTTDDMLAELINLKR